MLWDADELSESRFVKKPKDMTRVYQTEAMSVFGSTDIVGDKTLIRSPARQESPAPMPDSPQVAESIDKLELHQEAVPRLPIPSLKETCTLYLRSLEGLVNAEEYDRTEQYVEEFLQPGGIGEVLQEKLQAIEAKKECASWFEAIWDDAYLCGRDCIAININYFFGFENHPKHATHGSQIGRAASLVRAAAEQYVAVRDHTIPLDTERGAPLCMSQYRRVFCSSRVPQRGRDKIITYTNSRLLKHETMSKTTEYEKASPRHIVVLARNRFFKLDIIGTDGQVLPMRRVVELLATILRKVNDPAAPPGPPVGLFTTMHRDEWAECREHLVELGAEPNLKAIQQAIILLVLDPVACDSVDEQARLLLHGTGTNRWFDRHSLIVSRDGRAGLNFEHSVGDGITTLRVADNMYRADSEHCLSNAEVDAIVAQVAADAKTPEVDELVFRIDGLLDAKMKEAYEDFVSLIRSNETMTLSFSHFGGDFIKKSKVSPDAFVQLAFQLTHYRLFGRLDATYEAASTRGFLHGRTEVVRSVTRAAADFVEAANQPVLTRKINSKVPSQIELLRQAANAHVDYMKLAKTARGVDRHLLGLRRMCVEHNIDPPRLFTDPNFARSCHWILSTSHCGSPALCLFGFGPVVSDGFGLGYMIKNDSISCCVTSKYTHRLTSSTIFTTMLESSLLQMRAIVEADWEKRRLAVPRSLDFMHPTAYADFEYRGTTGFVYRSTAQRRSLYSSSDAAARTSSSHMDAMSGSSRAPTTES
uniref:Choline/carnitine acyltransferase domain-containing protein n=1 Tax=Neobodo designis TaxID=312471 RepID=A0A7S1Q6F5_NEODS|mmetsp:Transcript_3500/g.10862  ORF Transcript_3500/g.10862 Transcript_3500/m.10862 type:complete len:758 (+) Transcript_3500:101-2374(+)|eukprot:CAMPEP_0174829670 /NCGR_PEP_ID=MMETSP1114-20130205/2066_1 /TAXON_ID=312471 /ORGANISM="Neobodo designis, Strain CCAP 1951/1" /LENGTH=757 /DNA_ID=CAMNT_0016063427 /DNA_START=101 /DNA_END=2374 /DNA_ORIENTATION=-